MKMSVNIWPRWLAAPYVPAVLSEIPFNSQLMDVREQDAP